MYFHFEVNRTLVKIQTLILGMFFVISFQFNKKYELYISLKKCIFCDVQ